MNLQTKPHITRHWAKTSSCSNWILFYLASKSSDIKTDMNKNTTHTRIRTTISFHLNHVDFFIWSISPCQSYRLNPTQLILNHCSDIQPEKSSQRASSSTGRVLAPMKETWLKKENTWINSEVMLCGDSSHDIIIHISQSLLSLGGRAISMQTGQLFPAGGASETINQQLSVNSWLTD